jgi:murein tripeptide amidase MpaA
MTDSWRCGIVVVLILCVAGLAPQPARHAAAQQAVPPSTVLLPAWAELPATGGPTGEGPWVVRATYTDPRMVASLASWTEPWEVNREAGYAVLMVDRAGYERLLASGFRVEVDLDRTADLSQPRARLPNQTAGIPGYPCYRTVEETFATAEQIVADYPELATWIDVGDSWEKIDPGGAPGYDMLVLRLTQSGVPGPKPKLFVMSSVHAREYAPAELNTRFAEYLVGNYGLDADVTWLLDYHEIHLMLQANPDGRKWAEAPDPWWRKNTDNDHCGDTNDRGVDLNRNFEFQWACCGGSSDDACSDVYHGPAPASEPETQAIQAYLRSQFPDQRAPDLTAGAPATATGVFLDVHSYGEWVLWPWGFTETVPANGPALQTLGRKFAYFTGYKPEQAGGWYYTTDGATDDFGYGDLGLAAYTFEIGTTFHQDCATFEDQILPDNLEALLYAAKVARTPFMTPAGPDALAVAVAPPVAESGGVVTLTATITDGQYVNRHGTEPVQSIAAAEYTVNVPPWVTTTTPISHAMTAVDGAFDEATEVVEAAVDLTGLAPGRYIIFVRGRDADGNWGAVSAAFAAHGLYTLTVQMAGSGGGSVTSEPSGIACGVDCVEQYAEATVVTLTASADNSSYFAGWSGAADGSDPVVTTMITADQIITATFAPNTEPVARASASALAHSGDTVTLNGSASSDPDGHDLAFGWRQTSGPWVSLMPSANVSVTTFTAPIASSVLTFTLIVTDIGGLTDTDEVSVTVEADHVYLPVVVRAAPLALAGGQNRAYGCKVPLRGLTISRRRSALQP